MQVYCCISSVYLVSPYESLVNNTRIMIGVGDDDGAIKHQREVVIVSLVVDSHCLLLL